MAEDQEVKNSPKLQLPEEVPSSPLGGPGLNALLELNQDGKNKLGSDLCSGLKGELGGAGLAAW